MADEKYDWNEDCTRSAEDKERFHRVAKKLLRRLATELEFTPGSFDLRSNKAGPAVSGEITLHHEHIYIQADQSFMGPSKSLLIRTCNGRSDYSGGQNHFAPLSWLDDASRPKLKKLVGQIMEQKMGFDADKIDDPSYNPHLSVPRVSR